MAARDRPSSTESPARDRRVYLLVALSATAGIFFFVQHELDYTPPDVPAIVILVGLTLLVPLAMGYTGYSFLRGTATGLLPWLGLQVGSWLNPPVSFLDVANMANAFVIFGGMALPVAAITYGLGVGLRDGGVRSDREREFAVRLAAAILIAVIVVAAAHAGILSAGVDQ